VAKDRKAETYAGVVEEIDRLVTQRTTRLSVDVDLGRHDNEGLNVYLWNRQATSQLVLEYRDVHKSRRSGSACGESE